MKIFTLVCFSIGLMTSAFGQIYNPVKWTSGVEKVGDGEYVLTFQANIEDGWYVYSSELDDDGPVPTMIEFDTESGFKTVGDIQEVSEYRKEGHDEMFDMNVIKYSKKVTFKQKIVTDGSIDEIVGYLTFMSCNNERCLPPTDVDFEFSL